MIGYCCHCKVKQEIKQPTKGISKSGRHMIRGVCAVCGCKMCTFVKADIRGGTIEDIVENTTGYRPDLSSLPSLPFAREPRGDLPLVERIRHEHPYSYKLWETSAQKQRRLFDERMNNNLAQRRWEASERGSKLQYDMMNAKEADDILKNLHHIDDKREKKEQKKSLNKIAKKYGLPHDVKVYVDNYMED